MGGMTLADVAWIVSESGKVYAHDNFKTKEAAEACATRIEIETGTRYLVEDFETWDSRVTREQLEDSPLVEITPEFYEVQLNQLPPMYRAGAWGWFCCEYSSGSLTHQFVKHGDRYFTALVDMANRETWLTPERVDAMPNSPPVYSWFGRVALAPREMWAGDLTDGTGESMGYKTLLGKKND